VVTVIPDSWDRYTSVEKPQEVSRWMLALDPRWDFLRDNPRFRALATPPARRETDQARLDRTTSGRR